MDLRMMKLADYVLHNAEGHVTHSMKRQEMHTHFRRKNLLENVHLDSQEDWRIREECRRTIKWTLETQAVMSRCGCSWFRIVPAASAKMSAVSHTSADVDAV